MILIFIFLGFCMEVHTIANAMLLSHNLFRSIHISPPLKLDTSLSVKAQEYALEIVKKHGGVLVPSDESTRPGVGENLYMACDFHRHLKTGSEASWKW